METYNSFNELAVTERAKEIQSGMSTFRADTFDIAKVNNIMIDDSDVPPKYMKMVDEYQATIEIYENKYKERVMPFFIQLAKIQSKINLSEPGHEQYELMKEQQRILDTIGKIKRMHKEPIDRLIDGGLDATGAKVISTEMNMDDIEPSNLGDKLV
jgi:hypothetical protein